MYNYLFKPDWDTHLLLNEISISHLTKLNLKYLILDVDNTILSRRTLIIPQKVKHWIFDSKKYFKLHLVSNNPSEKRIRNIANQLELDFTHRASKPRRDSTLKALKRMNYQEKETCIIGDRIFTDIILGNRLGIYTILVKPIKKDGLPNNKSITQYLERSISSLLSII